MAMSTGGTFATALGAFVVGAGLALLLTSTLSPAPPQLQPPVPTIHKIKIVTGPIATHSDDQSSTGVRVDPEDLTVAAGDVVEFVNLAGQKARVTFSSDTPFLNLSDFDVHPAGGTHANLESDVVNPKVSVGAEYHYQVTPSGSTEQSPVIRIGPPLQSSDSRTQ